jgi:hypothetical protein
LSEKGAASKRARALIHAWRAPAGRAPEVCIR